MIAPSEVARATDFKPYCNAPCGLCCASTAWGPSCLATRSASLQAKSEKKPRQKKSIGTPTLFFDRTTKAIYTAAIFLRRVATIPKAAAPKSANEPGSGTLWMPTPVPHAFCLTVPDPVHVLPARVKIFTESAMEVNVLPPEQVESEVIVRLLVKQFVEASATAVPP